MAGSSAGIVGCGRGCPGCSMDARLLIWLSSSSIVGMAYCPRLMAASAAYIIGKNCVQFFTVDRSLSYAPRPCPTTYISSV